MFSIYKNSAFQQVINSMLYTDDEKSDEESFFSNENDQDYFEIDQFFLLNTSIERLRYFVLYKMKKKEDLQKIMTQILIDINNSLNNDTYVIIKAIQTLFWYQADFIPFCLEINSILYNALFDNDLSYDSKNLIILYYEKFGIIYSNEEILQLMDFSIKNNNNCRANIWKLEFRLILFYDYSLPVVMLSKIIVLYDDLKTVDKFLLTHIIASMLLSDNLENKNNIHTVFIENEKLMKNILMECADGKNITIITLILHLIKSYQNYNYYCDIYSHCITKKESENLNILIIK